MIRCRACDATHAGPECPVDEAGRPAAVIPGYTPTPFRTFGSTSVNLTILVTPHRPPDGDGVLARLS